MAEPIEDQKKDSIELQKQYLIEKFGALIKQIGEGYGRPLLEELILRLEKTIAEFHDEVSELIVELKDRSLKRHEKLKTLWERGDEEVSTEIKAETEEPDAVELSEWERRLEQNVTKDQGSKKSPEKELKAIPKEESQPEKKRRFGRKKK